ncbi:hypothetical protein BKA23_2780 [Rudaeicoccus suwonensis]|uniref:Uncharacterized protein n=2 Tax=Rudaeicoccus suwonensis TaxID=657409 RepID=A0A561E476_9MICO|nr:hypothetical protein BKA23_2780 [Rudaeicoccus suwonensis]
MLGFPPRGADLAGLGSLNTIMYNEGMTAARVGWECLARLDYAPLTVKPDPHSLDAYRSECEVPGYDDAVGFDAEKAPEIQRKPDESLWRRRYQLSSFARANGLTYAFRSNPKRWAGMPAKLPRPSGGSFDDVSKIHDVLEAVSNDGRGFRTAAMELTQCSGAVTGRDITFSHLIVVAVQTGTLSEQVCLKHRTRQHLDAPDLLEANYSPGDLFAGSKTVKDTAGHYDRARRVLTPELSTLILQVAPGYDLYMSSDWLYLMKSYAFADEHKKNADPDLLRERFEIAAQIGAHTIRSA